jgi:hypothetical protein
LTESLHSKKHILLLLVILTAVACSPTRVPTESQQLGLERNEAPAAVREVLNSCKSTDQEDGSRFLNGLAQAMGLKDIVFAPATRSELIIFLTARNQDEWQAKLGSPGGTVSKPHELVERLRQSILTTQIHGFTADEADIRKIVTAVNLNSTTLSLQSNQSRPMEYSGPREISLCESAYALTSLAKRPAADAAIERQQLNLSQGYDPNFCLLRTALLVGFTCALAAFGAAGGG